MSFYRMDRLGVMATGAGATMLTSTSPLVNKAILIRQLPAAGPVSLAPSPGATTEAMPPPLIAGQDQQAMVGAETPWPLYIGLGAGALVLIGGAVYLVKKRKASVAGYRRRRRSRRR